MPTTMAPSPTPPEASGSAAAAPAAVAGGEPLAIICGGGAFPLVVAEAATRAGRRVHLFALRGLADPAVEAWPHSWIALGQFGKLCAEMRRRGCRDVVFIGYVLRPRLRDVTFDWAMVRQLPRIFRMLRGGDNHLLTGVGEAFEDEGFRLLGAHEVAPEILVPAGRLGQVAPGRDQLDDVLTGRHALAVMGPLDIGQGVVVINRHVVAVEAAEGTDLMLRRCAELRANGRIRARAPAGVLVKVPKVAQDRRFDLPSLGLATVEGAARAGLAGIAVEAGGVIATDLEAMIRAADAAGMFVYGFAPENEAGSAT
ncbi:LpxI family protein [Ancylobacter oerskovii]|uniref:LpxI family protein n=1 Tax=Ancylobacter oerskovii TaxID=459519 RepID=A0ABW4Z2T7_9HYPH|nr:UDP-2,3-diacylglucosamine diphosphatase LpxI [Ancylobacter oerskovii]